MSELKFRIWKPATKRMDYVSFTHYLGGAGIYDQKIGCNDPDKAWMQFTGLKDKNGKDCFESDIIKFIHKDLPHIDNDVCVVRFENGAFTATDGTSLGQCTDFEIIGNIYSNAELLSPQ